MVLTEEEKRRLDLLLGRDIHEIETPALLVDLDIMERNMDRMTAFLKDGPVGIRPHFKSHKTNPIALAQIQKGAIGMTCAKLGEAEALADGGITDILIANQIVEPSKIARAAMLSKKVDLKVAVDSPDNLALLSQASEACEGSLGVVIEVEVGNNRAGVRTAEEALYLARMAASLPGIRYCGIMGYEGNCVFIQDMEERRREARKAYDKLLEVRETLTKAGLVPEIVSSGGTGTYMLAGRTEWITDIQAGSYIFMDTRYATIEGVDFEQSLTVLSTITSHPQPDLWVCDAGLKTVSREFGPAGILPSYGLKVSGISEEHVKLVPADPEESARSPHIAALDATYAVGTGKLRVGDKVHLVPSHCCTTVNLHDVIYGVRGGRVSSVWTIVGRGRSV